MSRTSFSLRRERRRARPATRLHRLRANRRLPVRNTFRGQQPFLALFVYSPTQKATRAC
jgi:hypothetical protein